MKKLINMIILILLFALLCSIPAGCRNNKNQSMNEAEQNGENVPDVTADDYDNRLGGMRYGDILETEEVFFFITDRRKINEQGCAPGCFMRYCVRETGESDIFCGDPTCMHNNEECPAFGVSNIYEYDGRIYYQRQYHEQGTSIRSGIFRMDPDGSSRELVIPLTDYSTDMMDGTNGEFMMHRGRFFVFMKGPAVSGGSGGFRFILRELHPDSDEQTVLFDKTVSSTNESRVFFHGRYAYLLLCHMEGRGETAKTIIELFRANIDTGESELIKKDEDSPCYLGECCFVDKNEDIYIVAPKSEMAGDEMIPCGAAAYKYIDGRFTEIFCFADEENGCYTIPLCGDNVIGGICVKRDGEVREKFVLWLTDYEGNTIVKDTLPLAFLTEEERQKLFFNVGSFADARELIFRININWKPEKAGSKILHDYYVVHYDYSDGSLKETLLGMSKEE